MPAQPLISRVANWLKRTNAESQARAAAIRSTPHQGRLTWRQMSPAHKAAVVATTPFLGSGVMARGVSISAPGVGAGASSTGFMTRTGSLMKSLYGRLFAPASIGGFGTAAAQAAAATGIVSLGQYATSGTLSAPGIRTFAGLTALRFSPVAGSIGLISGLGIDAKEKAKAGFEKLSNFVTGQNPRSSAPINPQWFGMGGLPIAGFQAMQQPAFDPSLSVSPSYAAPSATYNPSISPSVSIGGGGFGGLDASTLAILAAMFGFGGYALGRRKKKKRRKRKK